MNDLFCPLSEQESVLFVGGQQTSSPGFQIGGKSGGFDAFILNLRGALGNSQGVPTDTQGNSSKTGGTGVYPGGLNDVTYRQLLDRNPIFYTSPN